MTRESLEKLKALVAKRHTELEESADPRALARQRLVDSGLVLATGQTNPVFDSSVYNQVKVKNTGARKFGADNYKPFVKPADQEYIVVGTGSEHIQPQGNLPRFPKFSPKHARRKVSRAGVNLTIQRTSHKKK